MSKATKRRRHLKRHATFTRMTDRMVVGWGHKNRVVTLEVMRDDGTKLSREYRQADGRWHWEIECQVPVVVGHTYLRKAPIDHAHTRNSSRVGRGGTGQCGREYRSRTEVYVWNTTRSMVQKFSMSDSEFRKMLHALGKTLID